MKSRSAGWNAAGAEISQKGNAHIMKTEVLIFVTTICIFSGQNTDPLVRTLLHIFRHKRVLLWREGICRLEPPQTEQADLLILQNPDCREIDSQPSLLLFQRYDGRLPVMACGQCVAVVDSSDELSQAVLKQSGLRTITCGFFSKDVFTLSSTADNRLTVSLQRNVPSLFGRDLEPKDVVFELEDVQLHLKSTLLAVIAGVLCEEL